MASFAAHTETPRGPLRRGTYRYFHQPAGTDRLLPTGIVEHFAITPHTKDGTCTVQVTRDATKSPTPGWLSIEALVHGTSPTPDLARFTACWQSATEEAPKLAAYEISEEDVVVERFNIAGEPQKTRLVLPPSTLTLPLMRIFMGPVIATIAHDASGEAPVLVPTLKDLTQSSLFEPQLSQRKASRIAEDLSLIVSGRHARADLYRFEGGNYDAQSAFWIDPVTHMLIRYEFVHPDDGTRWQVELDG